MAELSVIHLMVYSSVAAGAGDRCLLSRCASELTLKLSSSNNAFSRALHTTRVGSLGV